MTLISVTKFFGSVLDY